MMDQTTDLPEDRGLAAVMKLRPVTFGWKDSKADAASGQQIGLVAKEVEAIFPEAVTTEGEAVIDLGDDRREAIEGTKTVSYAELVVALIKTV